MQFYENLVYDDTIGASGLYDLAVPDSTARDLFIYIHGGGIESGCKDSYAERTLIRLLADTYGVMAASINYRMYPTARFPDYVEDCAKAVAAIIRDAKRYGTFERVTVGGSSAGGYLSMMLFFDPKYLAKEGLLPTDIDGWYFDAGQPTTHFNILAKERGIDPLAIRMDEAAPMYFVDHRYEDSVAHPLPRLHFTWSEFDMTARPEQSELLLCLLRYYGYPSEKLSTTFMKGYRHCAYTLEPERFAEMIAEFLQN